MLWLTLRRHRWLLLIGILLLLGFCILFISNGFWVYHFYDQIGPTACNANGLGCSKIMNYHTLNLQLPFEILQGLIVLPLFIGVFVGAPLLPSEQRTAAFIRTQGVTLRRWLTIKIGLVTLATLLFTVVIALVVAWWTPPLFAAHIGYRWNYYESMGSALVGKTLFALLLSIAIGALMRRTLPAMIVTFFLMIVLSLGFNAIYPHILPPSIQLTPAGESTGVEPEDILYLNQSYIGQNGQLLTSDQMNMYCGLLAPNNVSNFDTAFPKCVKDKHLQWEVIYQPAENYWPIQIIETISLLILSLLLIPIIYWISRKNLN